MILIDYTKILTKDMSSFSIGLSINSIFQASLTLRDGWWMTLHQIFRLVGHAGRIGVIA